MSESRTHVGTGRYYELGRMSANELETIMLRGTLPDLDKLVGWEFRGMNHPAWAKVAGIKKFMKGFYRQGDEVYGYNCPVVQDAIEQPWRSKPIGHEPKRFGFYRVAKVNPTAKDNVYLNAALLNYGEGGNKPFDPSSGLRDYVVQVDPTNDDLYLGKAYYALGPLRVHSNFFLLERERSVEGPIRR